MFLVIINNVIGLSNDMTVSCFLSKQIKEEKVYQSYNNINVDVAIILTDINIILRLINMG